MYRSGCPQVVCQKDLVRGCHLLKDIICTFCVTNQIVTNLTKGILMENSQQRLANFKVVIYTVWPGPFLAGSPSSAALPDCRELVSRRQ